MKNDFVEFICTTFAYYLLWVAVSILVSEALLALTFGYVEFKKLMPEVHLFAFFIATWMFPLVHYVILKMKEKGVI